MAKQPYVSPLPATASCALCPFVGPTEAWKRHDCPGAMKRPPSRTAADREYDRFEALVRRYQEQGKTAERAIRQASIDVGWREPPTPMTDEVKAVLAERNKDKARRRAKSKTRGR